MQCNESPPLVLHIEDDDGDAQFVVRALAQGPIRVRITRAADGCEAISILKAIQGGELETPDLVLLDLNLPFYSGAEILDWLAAQFGSKTFPLVMFSSSEEPDDLAISENPWCDEYVVKPIGATEFQQEVESICNRYLCNDRLNLDPEPETAVVA